MTEDLEHLIFELGYRIRILRNVAIKEKKESAEKDLTDHERLILEIVSRKKDINISEIAAYFPTSPSVISTTIKNLEKEKRLVKREQSDKDERMKNVNLSEDGKQVLNEFITERISNYREIRKALGLSNEEIKIFQKAISKANKYFDDLFDLKMSNQPIHSTDTPLPGNLKKEGEE